MIGCPIFRALCEGWDTTALHPKPFPEKTLMAYCPGIADQDANGKMAKVINKKIGHLGKTKDLIS
jgi:hypothetical protein